MKNHKSKVLALCIASALLYGCGSDNDDSSSSTMNVQAYDGPVRGMTASYSCEDGSTGTSDATNDEGVAALSGTFAENPESCSITFTGNSKAVDMENGRDMAGNKYSAPKGLFTRNGKATVSPITTLIDKQLNGAEYNESTATEVLAALGLDEILNNGITLQDFLYDTEGSVEKLKGSNTELYSQLSATKMVLSDMLYAQPDLDPNDIAAATKNISDSIVDEYPGFPMVGGEEVVVDLKDELATDSNLVNNAISDSLNDDDITAITTTEPATKPAPTDPETPTGGTGGSGSSTGA